MKTPFWWKKFGLIPALLWPLSMVWRLVSALRRALIKPTKLTIPIWCVGNVTAGGGGKTPFCLHLGAHMKKAGINAYYISRGYGGKLAGPTLVRPTHSNEEVGDEALLLAKMLPTVVAHSRYGAAKYAERLGATLLIMDDGMQYPRLSKDKTFLMLKGDTPLGNKHHIPAGPLRESFANAAARVDAIVHLNNTRPITLGSTAKTTSTPVWRAATHLELPDIQSKKIVAFAGIAAPETFKNSLEQSGLEVAEFHAFADHHAYSRYDIERLIACADKHDAQLITTDKDWVRLDTKARGKILYTTQRLELENSAELSAMIDKITFPSTL